MLKIFKITFKDEFDRYNSLELLGTDIIDVVTTFNLSANNTEKYNIIEISFIRNFIDNENR
jgi:hypothetical protein